MKPCMYLADNLANQFSLYHDTHSQNRNKTHTQKKEKKKNKIKVNKTTFHKNGTFPNDVR